LRQLVDRRLALLDVIDVGVEQPAGNIDYRIAGQGRPKIVVLDRRPTRDEQAPEPALDDLDVGGDAGP
jgi:hypothetical protein